MFRQLAPRDAYALMTDEGYTYVDVRTEPEFGAGHPEGAVNVPAFIAGPGGMMPNPMFLQVMQRLHAADDKLILGCASGGRSSRGCQLLESAGFTNIVNMAGGFSGARNPMGQVVVPGWQAEDLPVSTTGATYADMQARARAR